MTVEVDDVTFYATPITDGMIARGIPGGSKVYQPRGDRILQVPRVKRPIDMDKWLVNTARDLIRNTGREHLTYSLPDAKGIKRMTQGERDTANDIVFRGGYLLEPR